MIFLSRIRSFCLSSFVHFLSKNKEQLNDWKSCAWILFEHFFLFSIWLLLLYSLSCSIRSGRCSLLINQHQVQLKEKTQKRRKWFWTKAKAKRTHFKLKNHGNSFSFQHFRFHWFLKWIVNPWLDSLLLTVGRRLLSLKSLYFSFNEKKNNKRVFSKS